MKYLVLEIGNDKLDTQHQVIEFDGTLEELKEKTIAEVESNDRLVLIDINLTDGKDSLCTEYFIKDMGKNGKYVKQYTSPIE